MSRSSSWRWTPSRALRPDNREVVAAEFLAPAAALRDPDMPPYIRTYLQDRGAAATAVGVAG